MPDATFTRPDLTTFTRLDGLGLEVTGQLLEPDRSVLACRVVEPDDWCRRCGCQGVPRDTVSRELAHEPFGWRPTTLVLTVRRYRCKECSHVWRQDTTAAAPPRAKISRAGLRWGLVGIVVGHLSMARVAEGLGVACWGCVRCWAGCRQRRAPHRRPPVQLLVVLPRDVVNS